MNGTGYLRFLAPDPFFAPFAAGLADRVRVDFVLALAGRRTGLTAAPLLGLDLADLAVGRAEGLVAFPAPARDLAAEAAERDAFVAAAAADLAVRAAAALRAASRTGRLAMEASTNI